MKTPKEFINNLKNKLITIDMLELVLFSINKRAKNCRDKKNEYYNKGKRSGYKRHFECVDSYKLKEKEYYKLKDMIIKKLLQPVCIHVETIINYEEVTYCDYEDDYFRLKEHAIYSGNYFDDDREEFVDFIDVMETEEIKNYYLYYETNNYSFHIPISYNEVIDIQRKSHMNVVAIDNFITKGKEINDLLSMQFVKKFIELIECENYQLSI